MTAMMYLNFCHISTLPVFCAGKDLIDAMGVDFLKMGDGWKKLGKGSFELSRLKRMNILVSFSVYNGESLSALRGSSSALLTSVWRG